MKVPRPDNESERLANLLSYELLDSSDDLFWDNLSLVAAELCNTPFATVSLVEDDLQLIRSSVGFGVDAVDRDHGFCAHTILHAEPLVIYDARRDDRFAANPFVTGEPHLCFYAGTQIVSPEGYHLGALCVIDSRPRELEGAKIAALQAMASQITEYLKLRAENRRFRLKYMD